MAPVSVLPVMDRRTMGLASRYALKLGIMSRYSAMFTMEPASPYSDSLAAVPLTMSTSARRSFQKSNSLAALLPWYWFSNFTPSCFSTSTQVGFRSPAR